MGWTEQEYNTQRVDFIGGLWDFIEWKNRKENNK